MLGVGIRRLRLRGIAMTEPSWWLGSLVEWEFGPAHSRRSGDVAPAVKPSAGTGDMPVMFGHFSVFNEWAEINSLREGHFLERIAPGAFERTIRENRDQMRVLFQHGADAVIGEKPIAVIGELREDNRGAYYEAPLLDADYVRNTVLPGLKAGVYGASFRFKVMKERYRARPLRSAHNREAIPEHEIVEAEVKEFGPVTWGAYRGATAGVRSSHPLAGNFDPFSERLAPELVPAILKDAAYQLDDGEEWAERRVPGDSGLVERERIRPGESPSWETRSEDADWWLGDDRPRRLRIEPDWFLA